jgi:hypothetical protein
MERMMKMTFQMSRQPRGEGKRIRKREEIKEPALVRQHRGLLLWQEAQEAKKTY